MLFCSALLIALLFLCPIKANASKKKKYLGKFKITYYCACSKCCGKWANGITATGTKAKAGRTIGVDPNIIPYGSKVKIGNHIYVAEDTGGGIKGKKQIDIFCKSHKEALRKKVKYKKVYLIKDTKKKTKKTKKKK